MRRVFSIILCLSLIGTQANAASRRVLALEELRDAFSDLMSLNQTLIQLPGSTPEGEVCVVSIMGLNANPESASDTFLLDVAIPEKKWVLNFNLDAKSDAKVLNSNEDELVIKQNDIHQTLNYWGSGHIGYLGYLKPYTIHKRIHLEYRQDKVISVEVQNEEKQTLCQLR